MALPTDELPPKIARISDPVHGFIEFTSLERLILDHPVAQRLRNIAQNGLAHYVFPELRTSRFSHCLGTMHLSSMMLAAAFRNSSTQVRAELAGALKEVVHPTDPDSLDLSAIPQLANEADRRTLRSWVYVSQQHQDALQIVEQSLRLAALFHDLGHLPFSHDFEYALTTTYSRTSPNDPLHKSLTTLVTIPEGSRKAAIHERLGLGVAKLVLRDIANSRPGAQQNDQESLNQDFVRAATNLAYQILQSPDFLDFNTSSSQRKRVLVWLHSLISGDLDADRCDYLLRDGRNFGFEFAPYNLNRLLDNLVVAKHSLPFSYVLAVRPQGLSSIESFLLSRFRSYQFGVRHHKVGQIAAALRYSIEEILVSSASFPDVGPFVNDIAELTSAGIEAEGFGELTDSERNRLNRYAEYDDAWFMSHLRRLARERPNEWTMLVCWRTRGPRSLWKRSADFRDLVEQSGAGPVDSVPEGMQGLQTSPVARWNFRLLDLSKLGELSRVTDELRRDGVLLLRHDFKPWTSLNPEGPSEQLFVQLDNSTLVLVSDYSAPARALRQAWMEDVQIQAFAESKCTISAKFVVEKLSLEGEA